MSNEEKEWKEVKGGDLFEFAEKGQTIEGTLVDVRTEQGEFKSVVYEIDAGGKPISVFGSTVLDGKMRKVSKGDRVKIEYKGLMTGKSGREYKDFAVWVMPATPRGLRNLKQRSTPQRSPRSKATARGWSAATAALCPEREGQMTLT